MIALDQRNWNKRMLSENTNIRFAQPKDIEALLDLCHRHAAHEQSEISTDSLNEVSLRRLLFSGNSSVSCLVAELEGAVAGYATFTTQFSTWDAKTYMYLDCLYVKEKARGRGLGFELMERVREEARDQKCSHIEWQTPTFNAAAIAFYRRLGATNKPKQRFSWSIEHETAGSQPGKILGPAESLRDPYRPRSTRMSEVRILNDWHLKTYQITLDNQPIATDVVEAAFECVLEHTVWPSELDYRYGFVILHRGEQAVWSLVQLWINDILRQFVYFAPLDDPTHFATNPMPGFNACVWELEVTKHERDAWVKHVMANPTAPDFEAYLKDSLAIEATKETRK